MDGSRKIIGSRRGGPPFRPVLARAGFPQDSGIALSGDFDSPTQPADSIGPERQACLLTWFYETVSQFLSTQHSAKANQSRAAAMRARAMTSGGGRLSSG